MSRLEKIVVGGCLVLALAAALWYSAWVPHRDHHRLRTCQANLHCLRASLACYCEDYAGLLPPAPAHGDWLAVYWFTCGTGSPTVLPDYCTAWQVRGAAGGGALYPYYLNCWIGICPADTARPERPLRPGAVDSYVWNLGLAGRPLAACGGRPLLWDRRPVHRGGRNVQYTAAPPGATEDVAWRTEKDCAALGLTP